MEHRERVTCDSITVEGVTIEVDVELSISVPTSLPGRATPRQQQIAGIVHLEPVQIRVSTRKGMQVIDL